MMDAIVQRCAARMKELTETSQKFPADVAILICFEEGPEGYKLRDLSDKSSLKTFLDREENYDVAQFVGDILRFRSLETGGVSDEPCANVSKPKEVQDENAFSEVMRFRLPDDYSLLLEKPALILSHYVELATWMHNVALHLAEPRMEHLCRFDKRCEGETFV